ncbi:MAG: acyl-CoA synthetase [Gammaproteobacteria bacterium]|nr:acyl-CoA synthetase [Gammaproteobacteria bacterium]
MTMLPFLPDSAPGRIVAWRNGAAVDQRQFLRDVHVLAARLPARGYVLNHCDDRYCFLVGLVAALLRGQVSLFPSNRAPQVLQQLADDFPGAYCLTDRADEAAPMELHPIGDLSGAPLTGSCAVPAFPADQPAAIAFTSGSTGTPKRYLKSWGGFVHEARVAGRALGLAHGRSGPETGSCVSGTSAVHGGRVVVATVPPQHMYGFIASIMLPTQFGYALDAARPFYPADIRAALAVHKEPAILATTPVHIRACVLDGARLPALDFILSSTAPLDAAMAAEAERLFDTRVLEFYGSTETGAIAARRQAETRTWRTFDDIAVALGERGFTVTAPYLSEPMVLTDSVEVNGPREFMLFGRDSDLIKIAGKRASLADLNARLLAIAGVQDGAFFAPDPVGTREPRLTAFAVAPGRSVAEILQALRASIDPVFLPRPLRLVASLPRNATGKLPRAQLMRLLETEVSE